jgi:CubicO group peptidase (beta-lactamase class C family)
MKHKTLFLYLLFIFLFQNNPLLAQSTSKKIGNYIQSLYSNNQFNGNSLIAENNKIIYENSFGFADLNKKIALTKSSQFPIASLTKTFTATAILQLKQKGKLQLDDAVQNYLPEFPYNTVTIRHLLSNTSGLREYYNLFDSIMVKYPNKRITNNDIIPTFNQNKTPLGFVPGERLEYNNVNFCIAALIIEKVSGVSYANYLQENIFKPAGMKNSIVPADRKVMQQYQVERYSFPNLYTLSLENITDIPERFKIEGRSNFYGNGGIVSTSEDLYKFDQALYNGALIGKEELEEAFTPTKLNNGKIATYNLDEKEVAYGLGWEIYTDEKNGKIVFHDGSISGLTSILVRNISKQQTIILLENTGSNVVFSASNALLNILNQQPYKTATQNFARLYGTTLVYKSVDEANKLLVQFVSKPEKYNTTEREIIRLGYELLRHNKNLEAIETFKTAIMIFPNSWNAYDSYGETLLHNNRKEEAVKMYQKSIELNPDNENGKKVLQQIINNK